MYSSSLEEDIKLSQRQDLTVREKLAVKLRLSEKRIISSTMDAVRQRLAPIRCSLFDNSCLKIRPSSQPKAAGMLGGME